MKWLKRKLRDWVRDANEEMALDRSNKIVREVEISEADPILNFRVFGAVGGSVVEFRRYDRKTDRSDTTTYIIHKEDDFGEKISKIANLEMIKQ